MPSWFRVTRPDSMLSPTLVVDRGLLMQNLRTMIAMAREGARLRPHVKTHKMPAVVRLGASLGITKHKVATIAEAEMVADAGGKDILLAYPLVGPNVLRLARLVREYPATTFRTLVDDPDAARVLSRGLADVGRAVPTLVDLDVGMGRTGIPPDDRAFALYQLLHALPNLTPDGLSAYDGHLHAGAVADRVASARPGVEQTLRLRDRLLAIGLPVPRLVLGGTPTFPIHAALDEPDVECSPGTCTLHDHSYSCRYPDLPFTPAAAVLTRVISRPGTDRLCLDLGHKSIAADPTGPRAYFPDLPDARVLVHSEEHLVIETASADRHPPGTPFLAFPTHICPTCALHRRAYIVEDGEHVDEWEIAARDRVLRF